MATTQNSCKNCGKPFPPRRGGGQHGGGGKPQVHCSDRCRKEWARKQMLAREWAKRPTQCLVCGGAIEQPPVGAPRRFCTETCKQRFHNRQRARGRPGPKTLDPRRCVQCGSEFQPKKIDSTFCYAGDCRQKAYRQRKARGAPLRMTPHQVECVQCGQLFVAVHPSAKYCSKTCTSRYWMKVKARRLRKAAAGDYADRQVFVRDAWICHLCGDPIDPDVKWPDRMCATIDHVLPIFHGGLDDLTNVAAAHWKCNHAKGAKAPTE